MIKVSEKMKQQVFEYCNEKARNGEKFTMWNVHNDHDINWVQSAILYGSWIAENSDDIETVELSKQEWD